MATGDRLQIADKPTLDNVNTSIGETDDTGGSETTGSVMAKLNENIRLNEVNIQGTNNIESRLSGVSTPYGTGMYGDLTFDSSTFTWPSQDYYNRYIIQVKSLTIPEGQTMKPPAKCDGLYILSQGDVTINGNIDIRGLRKTFGNVQISPTINVGDQEFELAVGGYAPKGGASGAGTKQTYSGKTAMPAPAQVPTDSIAGNINGGGVGKYGIAGNSNIIVRFNNDWDDTSEDYNSDYADFDKVKGKTGSIGYNANAPTALIIIAKGTVTINGKIIASATVGKNAEDGFLYEFLIDSSARGYFSMSGNGAVPPSGGGCVTIICNNFTNNGEIDTNGAKLICSDGQDKNTENCTKRVTYYVGLSGRTHTLNKYDPPNPTDISGTSYVKGGMGGKGGTFISTAGEIKVYTGVSE